MNLSNLLAVLLLYIFVSYSSFRSGLNVPNLFSNIQRFNLFVMVVKLRLITPVLFGIAKVEIFLVVSSFL
jgi:hypothetical protein